MSERDVTKRTYICPVVDRHSVIAKLFEEEENASMPLIGSLPEIVRWEAGIYPDRFNWCMVEAHAVDWGAVDRRDDCVRVDTSLASHDKAKLLSSGLVSEQERDLPAQSLITAVSTRLHSLEPR